MKKIYYLILVFVTTIVVFYILSYFFAWRVRFGKIKQTGIEKCTLYLSNNANSIILNSSNLQWDTGAGNTILFETANIKKSLSGYSFNCEGLTGKRRKIPDPVYFSKEFQSDSLLIKNLYFSLANTKDFSENIKNLNITGILGSDVICTSSWLFDIKNNEIVITDLCNLLEKPAMTLDFNSLQVPEISLVIDNIKIDNILFDTGANRCIHLLKEDIQQINTTTVPLKKYSATSSGLYSNDIDEEVFFYNQIKINNLCFDNVEIVQSTRRLLGLRFVRKFDKIFFDSKQKKISFYKVNKSNVFAGAAL